MLSIFNWAINLVVNIKQKRSSVLRIFFPFLKINVERSTLIQESLSTRWLICQKIIYFFLQEILKSCQKITKDLNKKINKKTLIKFKQC